MLEEHDAQIADVRNSRKQGLTDQEAQGLLESVATVVIARGKKIREQEAAATRLDDLKGPTGNYRAPMIRSAERLLVGFHPDTLQAWLDA